MLVKVLAVLFIVGVVVQITKGIYKMKKHSKSENTCTFESSYNLD